jgi:uncharacterized protein (DUF1778 family)
MQIDLQLSESIQARLTKHAAMTGKSIDDLVLEAVEQRFAEDENTHPRRLSLTEWKARLRAWAASHPIQGHVVDVSRESIYRGRGD